MTSELAGQQRCPHCSRAFETLRGLRAHWRVQHFEPLPEQRCSVCRQAGPLRAKGMCGRCYDKARRIKGSCTECGQLRVLPGGRRCQACITKTSTKAPSSCADCLAWGVLPGFRCFPCDQLRRRARLGWCPSCRRQIPLGRSGLCRLCQITVHSAPREGVCPDCGCWTKLVSSRCNSCQMFRWRCKPGLCTSCGQQVVVGNLGRCRRCMVAASRSGTSLPGRPIQTLEPDPRPPQPGAAGIQLFFAGLRDAKGWPAEVSSLEGHDETAAAACSKHKLMAEQIRLVWVPAKLDFLNYEHAIARAVIDRPDLMSSIPAFGAGRGWSKQTTRQVERSVAVLLEERCDQDRIDQSMLSVAAGLGLVTQRSIEFLQSAGLHLVDPGAAIQGWVNDRIRHLPGCMQQEVDSWIQVLTGRSARRAKPLKAQTVKVYLQVCLPVLNLWASRYGTLRQVTPADIEQILTELTGWEAVNTLTGLRSLFESSRPTGPSSPIPPPRFASLRRLPVRRWV